MPIFDPDMTSTQLNSKYDNQQWHFIILVLVVLIAYFKVYHAGFMNWDDGEYVLHNNDIQGFSGTNIKAWFSGFYVGNYHPLTMLSYAVDYVLGKQQPFIYHFTNIVLHTANACLLYQFVKKIQPHSLIALFVALLFAVHPSQTESVSWIAERKTVLFGFFFLLAMVRYTYYVATPSVRNMAVVFILGAAAMLSKGTAVTLPLSLLAVDIWLQRDLKSSKLWMEKIPLTLFALIIGVVAIKAQASGPFLDAHQQYGFFETFMFAAYAYVQYIIHFFVPVNLAVMYPYPAGVGLVQYLYLAVGIGIVFLGWTAWNRKWFVLLGGLVFYTVNILPLLQFIQFGESLMADRYIYIAGIGLLFPAVYYLYQWLHMRHKQLIALITLGSVTALLLVATFLRNDIWLSDFNFFDAMLDAFPNSAVAQFSVGAQLMKMGEYDKAEIHLDKAVRIDPNNYKAWHNKGALHLRQGRLMESLDALNKSIAINGYYKAYFSRAMLYEGSGKPDLAIADIDKVIAVQPQNARAYYIKGDCEEKMGKTDDALSNYTKAIQNEDTEPLFYIRRGLLYGKTKQNTLAINDLNAAVDINPANGEALYYRGVIKYQAGFSACNDLKNALQHGYTQAQDAINKMCKN
jgi:tetratricopeptide (TPR) repeat protein